MTFSGFPVEGIEFLENLAQNNEKSWFEANRQTYEQKLLAPAVAFVAAVGEALQEENPAVRYDTRTNGSGSLMRIYRDTRFSKDKTPYKTNISGMWWEGPGKKTQSPGYGFQLTAEGMGLMAGMFRFDKEQLTRYREAVDDDKTGPKLVEAIEAVLAAGEYEILGDQYKKVPRGYDVDHPRAEWLKYKGLWSHPREELTISDLKTPAALEIALQALHDMRPLQAWLARHVI